MTFAPTVAISAKLPPAVERSMRKPVSLFEASVHVRRIDEADCVVATSPVGAVIVTGVVVNGAIALPGITSLAVVVDCPGLDQPNCLPTVPALMRWWYTC